MRIMTLALASALPAICGAAWAQDVNVMDHGAAADGETDNTAAFQAALDAAAELGGGTVYAPAGHYRFDGSLSIPGAVTLKGTFETPPTDQRETRPDLDGTVLMVYANRGDYEAEPFIRFAGSMGAVRGLTITYPEWEQTQVPPVPYPPTIKAEHTVNNAVIDVLLLNSYEGIHFQNAARFVVRNVFGYPSYRGLFVDECYDIGRVENCHFWPFGVRYVHDDPYCKWVNVNGVAFEFARTDWQYVTNTFCFGYGVGYKFSDYGAGGCNGNFLGIGSDSSRRAVLVEAGQPWGILITNGEFVGRWGSTDSVTIEITPDASETKLSLTNCSFWGPIQKCVWARSPQVQFTANACNFVQFDNAGEGHPAVDLVEGKAIIQGSTFGQGETHIAVGEKVRSAIIMANQAPGGLTVENEAGKRTQLVANEVSAVDFTEDARLHYQLDVGAPGDAAFARRWYHREPALEWGEDGGTKRWSSDRSYLTLPINPETEYEVTMEVFVPEPIAAKGGGVLLHGTTLAELPQTAGAGEVAFSLPPQESDKVTLDVRAPLWQPSSVIEGSADPRKLGVALRSVHVKAQDAPERVFDANTGDWLE